MASARVLQLGLVLAFVCAACHAFPAETDNDPFTEGSDFDDVAEHENLSENIQKNLQQPYEEYVTEEALDDDDDDDDDESVEVETEDDTDALTNVESLYNSVTKSFSAGNVPKNIILSSDSNGVGSYGAVVNYDGTNQLVRIVGPGINDEMVLGPNVDAEVITTGNSVVVGRTVFSDTPGQLIEFDGQSCELRTYPQGTPVRQALATDQCSQLRARMEQVRQRATTTGSSSSNQNVAQSIGFGQTLPQTYANTISQNFPQTITNPFGQTVTNGNSLGQTYSNTNGQTLTNPFDQTITNPFGQTVTNGNTLGQTYSNTNGQTLTNPFVQAVNTPFGQTVNQGNSLGRTYSNTNGQTLTNPFVQTVTNPFGQTVTQGNSLGRTYSNTNGQTLTNPLDQTVTNSFGQTVTQGNSLGQIYSNTNGQTLTNPFVQTVTNPFGQTYSNINGQTVSSSGFGQAVTQPGVFGNSASASNWPLAANNVPFNGNSFLNGGNNSPFGSAGELFGRRPRRPFQDRRRRPGY